MAPESGTTPKGRFRRVEVKTWGDERFRALSAIPPCGQGLWLYLITGPHTGPIPGIFRAGQAAMAEELGWELEAFREAFGEVFREGMVKADLKARVMWIPKALKYNRPESPNVIKGWASEWELIPECDLKREAWDALRASVYAVGEAFGKTFDEAIRKPSPKPSAKPSGKAIANQEQEQEQEQEKDLQAPAAPISSARADSSTASPSTGEPPAKKKKTAVNKESPCPFAAIYASYHEVLSELPRVRLTDDTKRVALVRKRWAWVLTSVKGDGTRRATTEAEGIAWFREFWQRAKHNDWLMGRGAHMSLDHANWRASFDFLLSDKGMKHVLENTEVRETTTEPA